MIIWFAVFVLGVTGLDLKPSNSSNVQLNYSQIVDYLQTNSEGRTKDYFDCALHSIGDGETKHIQKLVFDLLYIGEEEHINTYPSIPACAFNDDLRAKLKFIFLHEFDYEAFNSGKESYFWASIFIKWLHKEKKESLIGEAYTLHIMASMFDLEIVYDFEDALREMTLNLNSSILRPIERPFLQNRELRCIYNSEFNKKYGFEFSDLLLVNPSDIDQISIAQNLPTERGPSINEDIFWHLTYPKPTCDHLSICPECMDLLKKTSKYVIELGQAGFLNQPKQAFETIISESLIRKRKTKNFNTNQHFSSTHKGEDYLKSLEIKAQMGDVNAVYELAQQHYFGNPEMGIEVNQEMAVQNYERAARMGHNYAEADLGLLGLQGNYLNS